MQRDQKQAFGSTGLTIPGVIYGTSYLGNLYRELPRDEKTALIKKWFECTESPVYIDSAGKYGAGLALETIGRGLTEMDVDPDDIVISNKLGWYRVPLTGDEPSFEPGAWVGLDYDCEQRFGYQGIMECFEQGEELLGGTYNSQLVSVHDPDECLEAASNPEDREMRLKEILDSYRALYDLKKAGRVKAVGIGSKDWKVIRELYSQVPFDWVMLANSYTIYSHPAELVEFMDLLHRDGVGVINSAVFHGGFLTGGEKFDYRDVDPAAIDDRELLSWRSAFQAVCKEHAVEPAEACMLFGIAHPAISALALNTSKPGKMAENVRILQKELPVVFWQDLEDQGLLSIDIKVLTK